MPDDVFGIVGSVLAGAFKVEAVVAEGGFGVVYRAQHSGFRAPVALKCLKMPERLEARQQQAFLEQFRAEAELMFRLSASIPNIVRPLHVDATLTRAGRFVPFIALEWLDGRTLDVLVSEQRKLERSPFALSRLVDLLTPAARALERAHHFAGPEGPVAIVHRDLKPENIFVARVGDEQIVKILDFGIARARSVASQAAGRVSSGSADLASFTPAYGAPEQWLPRRFGQTGPWTDVWGLALSMVEVLAGRPVIDGDQTAMMATALDPKRRPTPRAEGISVSAAVEAVFERALALDPCDRYGSISAFWSALQDALKEPRTRAREPEPAAPVARQAIPDLELQPVSVRGSPPTPSLPPASLRSRAVPADAAPRLSIQELDFDGDEGVPLELELEPGELIASRRGSQLRPSSAGTASQSPGFSSPPRIASIAPRESLPSSPQTPPVSAGVHGSTQPAPSSGSGPAASALVSNAHPSDRSLEPPPKLPPALPVRVSPPLLERLWPGGLLLALSVIVRLADQLYASHAGEVFTLGPMRAAWISVVFMVGGCLLLVYALLRRV